MVGLISLTFLGDTDVCLVDCTIVNYSSRCLPGPSSRQVSVEALLSPSMHYYPRQFITIPVNALQSPSVNALQSPSRQDRSIESTSIRRGITIPVNALLSPSIHYYPRQCIAIPIEARQVHRHRVNEYPSRHCHC